MTLLELINTGQYNEAIEHCHSLIAEGKKNKDESARLTGCVYLGIAYTRQRKFIEAKKIFDENYLEICDECKVYWLGTELINTYLVFGKLKAALNYITAYLDEHPNDFKGLYLHGHILYLNKDYDSALKSLLDAYDISQQNKGLLYNIGLIYKETKQENHAFLFFEKAYEAGNDNAVEELIKLLFQRTGHCDYENCKNSCCKSVQLKGINGLSISTKESFESLVLHDEKNSCWYKNAETEKGNWIFECRNFGDNNFCNDYKNRPQTCHDYPSSLITTRKCCSYKFELKETPIKFKSKAAFEVVVDVLRAYKYEKESQLLKNLNNFSD